MPMPTRPQRRHQHRHPTKTQSPGWAQAQGRPALQDPKQVSGTTGFLELPKTISKLCMSSSILLGPEGERVCGNHATGWLPLSAQCPDQACVLISWAWWDEVRPQRAACPPSYTNRMAGAWPALPSSPSKDRDRDAGAPTPAQSLLWHPEGLPASEDC